MGPVAGVDTEWQGPPLSKNRATRVSCTWVDRVVSPQPLEFLARTIWNGRPITAAMAKAGMLEVTMAARK